VYAGLQTVPPVFVAIGLLALVAARLMTLRRGGPLIAGGWLAACALAAIVVVSPLDGVRLYPVALSLALALVFAASLLHPPTAIERLARLTEPNLPPEGVAYTRKVTIVWLAFFVANAAISAWTALQASLEVWTLYNGFLSYVAIAALFAGELALRRRVRRAS
jgi:uncharacterized membrane protein